MANETEAIHTSPLVKAVASRTHALDYEGIDIFVGLYVARKPGAENLNEYWKRTNLSDELAEEQYDIATPSDEDTAK